MVPGGDDEEGAISDPGSEMAGEDSERVKVHIQLLQTRTIKAHSSRIYNHVYSRLHVMTGDCLVVCFCLLHCMSMNCSVKHVVHFLLI